MARKRKLQNKKFNGKMGIHLLYGQEECAKHS